MTVHINYRYFAGNQYWFNDGKTTRIIEESGSGFVHHGRYDLVEIIKNDQ